MSGLLFSPNSLTDGRDTATTAPVLPRRSATHLVRNFWLQDRGFKSQQTGKTIACLSTVCMFAAAQWL
jgi:hypothetical protein